LTDETLDIYCSNTPRNIPRHFIAIYAIIYY